MTLAACILGTDDSSTQTNSDPSAATTGTGTGGTGGTEPEPTGGGVQLCGWDADQSYYACAPDGDPGVEDPMGLEPLNCVDPGSIVEGADCDPATGPIKGVGCCDVDVVYFCTDEGKIFKEECTTPGTTDTAGTDTTDTAATGDTTDTPTTDPTGGAGGCGWNAPMSFYSCAPDGEPGVEDPGGTNPLACPDPGSLMEGAECKDVGEPPGGVGCCDAAANVLWYCGDGLVVREECP